MLRGILSASTSGLNDASAIDTRFASLRKRIRNACLMVHMFKEPHCIVSETRRRGKQLRAGVRVCVCAHLEDELRLCSLALHERPPAAQPGTTREREVVQKRQPHAQQSHSGALGTYDS